MCRLDTRKLVLLSLQERKCRRLQQQILLEAPDWKITLRKESALLSLVSFFLNDVQSKHLFVFLTTNIVHFFAAAVDAAEELAVDIQQPPSASCVGCWEIRAR